ncbi:MAG TPA: hypothetical protein VNT75_22290 [Symbiobacteriaceae bacterium]|nr:hypothetical protein [Symbiobacteriaceae bacterium]
MENRPHFLLLPRLADGRLILLQRDPGPAEAGRWQLPTAPMPEDGDIQRAAALLLHSTTDYVPARLQALGVIYAPGALHCFLAEPLKPSPWLPAETGRTMTSPVHLAELRGLICAGAVRCAKLLGALMLLDAAEQYGKVAATK